MLYLLLQHLQVLGEHPLGALLIGEALHELLDRKRDGREAAAAQQSLRRRALHRIVRRGRPLHDRRGWLRASETASGTGSRELQRELRRPGSARSGGHGGGERKGGCGGHWRLAEGAGGGSQRRDAAAAAAAVIVAVTVAVAVTVGWQSAAGRIAVVRSMECWWW